MNLTHDDFARFRRDPLRCIEKRLIAEPAPVVMRFGRHEVVFVAQPRSMRHILRDHRHRYADITANDCPAAFLLDGVLPMLASSTCPQSNSPVALTTDPHSTSERGMDLAMACLTADIAKLPLANAGPWDLQFLMSPIALRMGAAASLHLHLNANHTDRIMKAYAVAHKRVRTATWRVWDRGADPQPVRNRTLSKALRDIEDVIRDACQQGQGLCGGRHISSAEHGQGVLMNEAVLRLVARIETTGRCASWLVYALACRPDLIDAVRVEADQVGPEDLTRSQLRRMPVSRAVVEEVMRLYPPVRWFGRRALTDDVIDGVEILPGTPVFITPWALHRQPDLWPNPGEVDPNRFIGRQFMDDLSYIPFGADPRVCTTQPFATDELQAIALAFVSAFDIIPLGPDVAKLRPHGSFGSARSKKQLTVRLSTCGPTASGVAA